MKIILFIGLCVIVFGGLAYYFTNLYADMVKGKIMRDYDVRDIEKLNAEFNGAGFCKLYIWNTWLKIHEIPEGLEQIIFKKRAR